MTDDDLERTLRAAFDAETRAKVDGAASPPAPRFRSAPATRAWYRAPRLLAPLSAAAAVVAVIVSVTVATSSSHRGGDQAAASRSAARSELPANASAVHVKLLNDDGARYGVGMPVIAYFSRQITDGRALQQATVATVNGTPVHGAWYFEKSAAGKGPIEAHFRLAKYWPAHADVRVSLPIKGLSAGNGLTYDDSLTTHFRTGAATIVTVTDRKHRMVVETDGKTYGVFRVSLGAKASPTRAGTKVIMEKPGDVTMKIAPNDVRQAAFAERLTYGGEYLHAAPWNEANIKRGVDSSNGCTNLLPADAAKLYGVLEIGDVVKFPDADGPAMTLASGYGDWNVPWPVWLTGGDVPTR